MEKVSNWEETDEIVLEWEEKAIHDFSYQDWTLEGVSEAGNLIEELLGEVIAFSELREIFEGTVLPNYYITNNNCQADQTPHLVQGVHPSEAIIKDIELGLSHKNLT